MTDEALILLEHEREVLDLVLSGDVDLDHNIALVRAYHAGQVTDLELVAVLATEGGMPWWVMVLLMAPNPNGDPAALDASAAAMRSALSMFGRRPEPVSDELAARAAFARLRSEPFSVVLPDILSAGVSMSAVLDLVLHGEIDVDADVRVLRSFHRGQVNADDLKDRMPDLAGWATYLLLLDDPRSSPELRTLVSSIAAAATLTPGPPLTVS